MMLSAFTKRYEELPEVFKIPNFRHIAFNELDYRSHFDVCHSPNFACTTNQEYMMGLFSWELRVAFAMVIVMERTRRGNK